MAELLEPAASFPHRSRIGVLGRFSWSQLAMMAIAVLILLPQTRAANPVKAVVETSPVWGTFAALGVLEFAQIPILAWVVIIATFAIRQGLGQTMFTKKLGNVTPAGTLRLPGGLDRLEMFTDEGTGAIVWDPKRRIAAAVLHVRAGSFGLADSADKQARVDAWSAFLAGLRTHSGMAGIQVLLTTSTGSPTAIEDYAVAHGLNDAPKWVADNYRQLLTQVTTGTPVHESYLVVCLEAARIEKRIKDSGGGKHGLAAVMSMELLAVQAALRDAQLGTPLWQMPRDVARIIREAYDPASAAVIAGRDGEREGVAPASAGPMGFTEHVGRLEADSMMASVWEITEWPRIESPASFLRPIINLPYPHAMSMTLRPRSMRKARKEVDDELSTLDADDIRVGRSALGEKATKTMTRRVQRADAEQRMADLASGHAALEYVGTVMVRGTTIEELELAESALREAAGAASLELRRLVFQQAPAFAQTALPLGLGVRGGGDAF